MALPGFVVVDDASAKGARAQIAFYGSTPAYRPVLELHGWGELQTDLNRLSKQGEWEAMGGLIGDDVLDAFAITCPLGEVATQVRARWDGLVDRFSFYSSPSLTPERLVKVLADFKGTRS